MNLIKVLATTLLVALVAGALMVALALAAPASTPAAAPLPPRPETEASADKSADNGATIRLELDFGDRWYEFGGEWGELWTAVQWQDAEGDWNTVTGWQGSLDTIEVTETGAIIGHKGWWVSEGDLGAESFRWQVFASQGGQLVATSDPFDLPLQAGWTVLVQAALD